MLNRVLLRFFLRQENELGVLLGSVGQKGTPIAFIPTEEVWREETIKHKIKSVLFMKWIPSENILSNISARIFNDEYFGLESDYNEKLYKINYWHNSRKWDLSKLTNTDIEKTDSLDVLSILLSQKHKELTSTNLHLHLSERVPSICTLLHPMVVKVPVRSIQYHIDIYNAFVFNKIRESQIPYEDDLISYIYDLQGLQKKTASCLHEFLRLIDYNERNKKDALIIQAELSAITQADIIISYLKATIEKIIVIIGLMYGVTNLESKKEHKKKLDSLYKAVSEKVKKQYYFEFITEIIKSESIEELNNYRTGLLHKKGISNLQPHSYFGQDAQQVPFKKVFDFLIEQHSKNSAVIICMYALLTDKLVELKIPDEKFEDLPF